MYEKFYGFTDRPFNLTPDSRFFYASTKHEEALSCLLLAISDRNGFVVITGEIGSGKTTVCRTMLNKLDPTTKVALVLNTHLGKKELITTILEDLGVEYKSRSKTHLLAALNKYLLKQAADDINVVLIIDEAQNLTPSVIEEVRMLSNLETETEKLIQIVLIGQPELRKKLTMPKLEQFRQRVVMHYHLDPLGYKETTEYIKHRLIKAGNAKANIFSQKAVEAVYQYAQGVPRLINLACHNALISGLVYEASIITKDIADEAINELVKGLGHSSLRKTEENNNVTEAYNSLRTSKIANSLTN
ncbi:ExeA family protein [Candidatus Omnitrophota bacterium]